MKSNVLEGEQLSKAGSDQTADEIQNAKRKLRNQKIDFVTLGMFIIGMCLPPNYMANICRFILNLALFPSLPYHIPFPFT